MIVDAAWYEGGHRSLDVATVDALADQRGRPGFAWLGLRLPADDELSTAARRFEIPDLAIADARHRHDRPKVERHGACLLAVVPTARYVDEREEVSFGELFFYVGADFVVTVRYGQAAPLRDVRSALEHRPELLAQGPGAVLQAALMHVVRSYEPVVAGLENDVREVERDVFSERRGQPTKRIYFLMREAIDFLIALEPMSAAVKSLVSPECRPWVDRDIVPLFQDIDEELADVVERARGVRDLLDNTLSASNTQAANQQNEDTRRISAWVAIGVIPTVVAGLFGMNLGGIPGQHHVLGFAVVVTITLVASFWLYRRFKAADWL